jgi:phytoene desaturase|nr:MULTISPECIES: phytoene desaturase [unclassified Iodidimonas]
MDDGRAMAPFSSEPLAGPGSDAPHAVVIGSGFGGLAAAVRLGARGYRVTIVEKCDGPGGRATVFRQDGFVFDAGPTIVTAPFLFEELWALCGKKLSDDVDLRPISPFYRIRFDDGMVFDYTGDREAMRAEIGRFSPEDVAGYDRFMAYSQQVFEIGFEQLGDVPFSRFRDMLKVGPDLIRLGGYRSVYQAVSRFIKDPRLRVVLSFHPLLVGGNPFTTTSVYNLIGFLEHHWGVHFAMGGTGRLVDGLVGLIKGQGNHIRYGAGVEEILLDGRRACGVRLQGGETIRADIVVSNACSASTYRTLLPAYARRRWTNRKIDRARYSMSLFVWYFGTKKRYEDVPHHQILLGPRYRGLLRDIFKSHHLAKDFSLYLHRPTATDPSLAPAGCDAFYVLSPVPHLDGPTDWRSMAEPYRRSIEQALERTVLPGLSDQVISSRLMTPLDFRDQLSSLKGAAFGLEPVLTQSAWFRPHNRSEDIENLFLVGAGTHPGAGLPGVLTTAKILDKVVPDAQTFA